MKKTESEQHLVTSKGLLYTTSTPDERIRSQLNANLIRAEWGKDKAKIIRARLALGAFDKKHGTGGPFNGKVLKP